MRLVFRHFVKRTRKSISADGSRRARDEATKARLWSAAGRLLPPCAAPHELLDLVWRTNSFVGEALLTFRALLLLLFFSSVFVARPIDRPPVLAALPIGWLSVGGGGDGGDAYGDGDAGGGGDGGDIDGDGGCGGDDGEAILVGWGWSPKRHAVGGGLHVRVSFSPCVFRLVEKL